jgi:hypothetical protein
MTEFTIHISYIKWLQPSILLPMFLSLHDITSWFLLLKTYELLRRGSFNNYVDKMRGEGVKKCKFFCPRSGYKNCPRREGGGGQKMAKFCPRSCWMTPRASIRTLVFRHLLIKLYREFFGTCPWATVACNSPGSAEHFQTKWGQAYKVIWIGLM